MTLLDKSYKFSQFLACFLCKKWHRIKAIFLWSNFHESPFLFHSKYHYPSPLSDSQIPLLITLFAIFLTLYLLCSLLWLPCLWFPLELFMRILGAIFNLLCKIITERTANYLEKSRGFVKRLISKFRSSRYFDRKYSRIKKIFSLNKSNFLKCRA